MPVSVLLDILSGRLGLGLCYFFVMHLDKGVLHNRYYQLMFRGKNANVAKTAVARELACFMWGMLTGRID